MPHFVNFELKCLCHMIERQIEESEQADFGLSRAQGGIIHFLSANTDRDIFQKDIEERFNIRRSTVSVLLSGMEQGGYVQRTSVDSDARLKKVTLTDKAKGLHDRLRDFFEDYNSMITQGITDSELDTFFAVMDKIKNNIVKKEGEKTC